MPRWSIWWGILHESSGIQPMYHVYMINWDFDNSKKLLSVAKTEQHADDLVDEYSEMYPHAYIDYDYVTV